MKLDIISPEKILYSGEAQLVTLPGMNGSFTILKNHAPIISILVKGKLVYRNKDGNHEMNVGGGFIEAKENVISVCIE